MRARIFFILIGLLLAGCGPAVAQPGQDASPPANLPETDLADMTNPASAYCELHGYKLEIRTADDGSQIGVCLFEDGSECEEWAYFRGECAPASQAPNTLPTETPALPPFDSVDYQGWWSYTHPDYGFSLLLPPDWVVDETAAGDPLLKDHLLNLHPQDQDRNTNLRITFRQADETEVLLWPTGVGSGEFVPQGTLEVAGGRARVVFFVCPTGEVQSIWFEGDENANLRCGDLEFGFIFSLMNVYCQADNSLDEEAQRIAEMIVASLTMP